MKKIFYTIMAIAISAFTLQSCEDVPAPYDIPGISGGSGSGDTPSVEAKGDGTLENPFNVAGVIAYVKELGSDVESPQEVYIKGKVKTITTDESTIKQYGNHTFTMVDEGSETVFTAFQVYGPGKKKFTSVDQIKEGDEVIVYGKVVNYKGNTPETVGKGASYVYSINGEGGTAPGQAGTPAGTGTQADPYNVAGVLAYINTLGSDVESPAEVYVKGKVSANNTTDATITQYGNMTFTMIDEGCDGDFTAFQVYGPGKKKFTAVSQIKEGDEVIVCGKVVNYKGNTPETVGKGAAYVYSINGKSEETSGGDTPSTGDVIVKTCAEASAIALALAENNVATSEVYSITGYITNIVGSVSKNQQTFWMDDTKDGGKVFEAYWANLPSGVSEFTVGMKVRITGNIMKYNTTPEIKNATVEILEGGSTGGNTGGGEQGGGTADSNFSNGDFESWSGSTPTNWKSSSSASSATLSQSTDAHGGQYSVCVAGSESANKRLAYKELTLEAGTYTFSFYAKRTADPSQVRPGYVPVTDGKVGSYVYGDYATLNDGWNLVSYTFTLDAKTTICLVVMNPKKSSYSSGADVLIDDATLVKSSSAKRINRRR